MDDVIIKVYSGGFVYTGVSPGIGIAMTVKCFKCMNDKIFHPEDFPDKIPFDKPVRFKCTKCETEWGTRYRFVKSDP